MPQTADVISFFVEVQTGTGSCSYESVEIKQDVKNSFTPTVGEVLKTVVVGGNEEIILWSVNEFDATNFYICSSCPDIEWLV